MTKRFSHPGEVVPTVPAIVLKGGDLYAWGGNVGIATLDTDPTAPIINGVQISRTNEVALRGVHYVLTTPAFAAAAVDGVQVFATAATGVVQAAAAGPRFIGHAIVLPQPELSARYGIAPTPPVGLAYVLVNLNAGAKATY